MRKMTLKRKILIAVLSVTMIFFFALGTMSFFAKEQRVYAETPVTDLVLNGENDIVIGDANTNGVTTTGLTFETTIEGTWSGHIRGSSNNINTDYAIVYQLSTPVNSKYYDTIELKFFVGHIFDVSFFSSEDKVLDKGLSRRDATLKNTKTVYLNTKNFADSQGMVKNFTLRVNSATEHGQIFLDSVTFKVTGVTYHDTTEGDIVYDKFEDLICGNEELNGIDYTNVKPVPMQKEKGYHIVAPHFYIASSLGTIKKNSGYAFTILFKNAYKAELLKDMSFYIHIPNNDWYMFSSDTSVLDTSKAVFHTTGISESMVSLKAKDFADSNGYFSGITFYTPNNVQDNSIFIGKITIRRDIVETLTADKELQIIDVGTTNVWSGNANTNGITVPGGKVIDFFGGKWNQASVGIHYGHGAVTDNDAFVLCFNGIKGENIKEIKINFVTGGTGDYYFFNSTVKTITPENAQAQAKGLSSGVVTLNGADFTGSDGYIRDITILKHTGGTFGVFVDSISFSVKAVDEVVTKAITAEAFFADPHDFGITTEFTVGTIYKDVDSYSGYTRSYSGVKSGGKLCPGNTVISLGFRKNYILPLNYNIEFSIFSGIKGSTFYFFANNTDTNIENAILAVEANQYQEVSVKLPAMECMDSNGKVTNFTMYIKTEATEGINGQIFFNDIKLAPDTDAFAMLGASVRTAEPAGLGFGSSIDNVFYDKLVAKYGLENVATGTIITRSDFLTCDDELIFTHPKALNIVNEGWKADSPVGKHVYRGSIVGLKPERYTQDFTGRGYIAVTTDGFTDYIYTSTAKRNIRDVATLALNNPDENFTEAQKAVLQQFAGGKVIDNGNTLYKAVLPAKATVTETNSGNIFVQQLNASANTSMTVVNENTSVEKGIYIGNTKKGMNYVPSFNDEEAYIIAKDKDNNIYIRGNTERGTMYGVYDFLNKYLGVNFIGNGIIKTGEVNQFFFQI